MKIAEENIEINFSLLFLFIFICIKFFATMNAAVLNEKLFFEAYQCCTIPLKYLILRNKRKEIGKFFSRSCHTYSNLLKILQLLRIREGFYEGFEGAAAIVEAREQQQPPKQLLRISLGRIGAHHVRNTHVYFPPCDVHTCIRGLAPLPPPSLPPRTDTPRAGMRAFSKYYRTIFLPPPPRVELCA